MPCNLVSIETRRLESIVMILSTKMEKTTMIFKWMRGLSREGFTTSNLYFSELHESLYYAKRILRPHYITVISNPNEINEFSLATSNFDMSYASWLVIFIYEGSDSDYCHNPPGNIFHLKFNSKVLVRCGTENILREWYSIDPNRTEIVDVATWSLEKGIITIALNSLYERRHNLRGLVMRAIVVNNSPFVNVNKNGELDGMFGKILTELCGSLNFTFDIVSEVNEYGSWNSKEKIWSGAVGELYAGRADISISDFSMTNARLNVVDFTFPLVLSKISVYFRKPQGFAINWSSYFLTFSNYIWVVISGILVSATMLLVFLKIRNGTDCSMGHLLSDNFLEIWEYSFVLDFPERSSLKIAYFSMFLLSVVLWAAYSAALISFLTSAVIILPFRSLEDFVADGTYQFAVTRGTADYDLFANFEHPLSKNIMELMLKEEELPNNVLEGFIKICKNRKLAIYSSNEIENIINLHVPCKIVSFETGCVESLAMILSKHNPFTELINYHLQKFIKNGMVNRLKGVKFEQNLNYIRKPEPVYINSVISLILLIMIGIILSICILIIEKCVFVYKIKEDNIAKHMPLKKSVEFYLKKKKSINNIGNYHENRKCARIARSYELLSIGDGHVPFIIDVCKLYRTKSTIFLYAESIKEMEMTTMVFKWTRALSREGFSTSNLYFSELHESSYYIKRIVRPHYVAVISSNNAINEFSLATNNFDMSFAAWLVIFIYEGNNSDYCHNPPGNIFHLRFNSEVLVRCGTENILREWYSIDPNRTEIDDVATWSLEKRINNIRPDSLYERRYNLQGLVMRTTIVRNSPFVKVNKNGELDGMFGRILTELCGSLNFTFDIVSEVEEYGILNPKEKTWSGAVGELYAGRADISISDFSMTSARLNVVDYTLPLLISNTYLYIKKPQTFSNYIWIAIFGILVSATMLLVFLKIRNGTDCSMGHLLSDNFLEIWEYSFVLDFPERSSLKIAYFSMFLLSVVLWAAYSAALISFLASAVIILPFRSLEDFVADGTYQFAVTRGTADYDLFINSADPLAKKLKKFMLKEEELPLTVIEGFRKICENEKLAMYSSYDIKKSINSKIPCNLISIETGRIDSLAIILSKRNPFTDVINFHLQKFINNGMMNRLKDTKFKMESNNAMKHQPVLITSIISLIFFILIGIILSTCILILEKSFFAYKNKKDSMVERMPLKKSSEFCVKRKQKIDTRTVVFQWTRELSRENFMTSNMYFSELHKSSYYVRQTIRPHYIAVLSSYNAINEFSLATNNFDMSFATWLVIFVYKANNSDYCYSPPGNIFHLKFNTEMLVRCGRQNILREWYSIHTNRTEINDFATWSFEKGIIKMVPDSLYDRRYNLQGLTMKAVTVQDSPFIQINKDGKMDGVFGRILRELCATLNFSLNIISEVKEYGTWNANEKIWSGAVGEIYAGRADISISDFSMTSARFNAVDFTFPLLISRNCLYIQEPHIFAIEWSSYFLAFSLSVWIAMFGISVFVTILLIFFKKKNGTHRNIGYLLSDNILEIWGILCQQGLPDFPERLSLRIPYVSILFMALVLLAAYSAAFISFLTFGVNTLPFDSLETFVEDGTYQLAVFRGTSDYEMFTNSKNPLAKEIIKLMIKEEELPITILEGFQKTCENKKLASYTKCTINIINFQLSLVKANVHSSLQKFINNGVMQRLKDMTFQKKFNDMKKYYGPVSITSVISLIFFIQIGITLSIFILIIEKCIFARKNKKKPIVDRIPSIESLEFDTKRKKNMKNIMARSYELYSYNDEYISLIIDISKLYGTKYIVFLYAQSIEEMEVVTTILKWTRALSREGFTTSNLYFSELQESSYYIKKRIVQPYYIPIISSYNAIKQFSLATTTIDMSYVVWLVLFVYKGDGFDYCHNPPGNIFHLSFNTEMLVRCGTENILREWYTVNRNRTEIADLVIWNLEEGITDMVTDSLYDRRYNLQGLIMRAVIVKDSPFINLNQNGELDGMFGRIFKELCVTLNCSFDIVSQINEYGIWNSKENTWTGAMEELYAGRADISLSDFSMTSARMNIVDFTFPLLLSENCLYIQEPKIFAIKWSSYFMTFSKSIWIAISGISVFTMVLLIFPKIKNGTDRNIGHLLSDNFLEIWGIFCQQGLADFPYRYSLRIAYFSIFLLAVVLSAAYSAALISFLTSVIPTLPFHSLEDFVEDGTYQFLVPRGTADYDLFSNSADPLAKKLMKLMPEKEKLPITILEGFRSICTNRKQAIFSSEEIKKILNLKIPCNVVSIKTGRIDSLSIILSKHNQFTGIINFHLQKFINNGMMNRLKDTTFKKNFNAIKQHQPVQIVNVITLIFFILIGVILSIFILIIEKYIFARKNKKLSMIHIKRISSTNEKKKRNRKMSYVARLKMLLVVLLLLPKIMRSYELLSVGDEGVPLIIDICKLYESKSIIFLYGESIKEMEMTTTIFKWTRALSREGFTTSNLYFSQLHESSYYVKRIVRPHYIAVISNYEAINEFSLATNTFDMSFAAWLVLFIYKGRGFDYCHNPPGNIFHLRFDSELVVRCGTENILREWYSIDPNRTVINDFATWSLEKGITRVVPGALSERRCNLQGLTMRAVIVKDSPFVDINKNDELEGVFGRVLKELCVTLNFSLKIVSKVNEYGRWNPKENTWSGAIGEIYAGRADISISDFSMTSARLNVVDFTLPLVFSKNCIFIKEPNKFAIKWSSYFQTFSHSVWIAMFGVIVLAMIVLVFLKIKNGTDRNIGQLLSDNFLEIWGIFCQQGLADFPDRFSLRIAYFSIFLLAVVLSAAYSAALISFLTSVIQILPFHSLEDFVEDGTYQFAVLRGTADYDIVANARDPLAKKLMKLMPEEKKLPITLKEGFRRICKNHKLTLYTSTAKKENIRFKIPCNVIPISIGQMEMTTMIFKWTRALSREGYLTSNLYFSELHESSYYVKRIVRPHYIALISNYESINEFSLATNTFDMSFAAWLVLFIYKGRGFDYCHNPPGNIFHLRFDSEMLVRCGTENILREWYSINSNRTEIDDVATWSLEKGITKLVPDSLYERRHNLHGLIMRAVIVKDSSFINVKGDGKMDGKFGKILTELSVALNFSFDIISIVAENGRLNTKNNTWSGAIGELYAGRADVSITDFSMTSARLNAIDFALPLVISKKRLYFKEPQLFTINWSSYLLAFSNSIWISIFGVLIVVPILLIFFKMKNESSRNMGNIFLDNFIDIWGIFCQQGLPVFPHRSSLRIAYFSIFLLTVVLSAAYSAALISFLTSIIQRLPFRSLEDFVEDGTYQFIVFSGSADYETFTNARDPLAKKLKKLIPDEKKLPLTMLEGFETICKNPKLALYTSEARKESINHKIPCNVASVDAERLESLAIILSKRNPFTDVINFQ
ncbi:hypothetical protein V1478_018006 [Vespula squamosa]|uniref:Ionotropic glutamate receptor L-glutamate and glycine-binding domain-containing protein n=1 Tax=Vespula squamosa TaxID=30214 RepID=A0ABD1ZVU5_VESSQ